MTTQDKIKEELKNIKLVSKDKPEIIQSDGYVFEIYKTYMIAKKDGFNILYKSKRGFTQEELEDRIDDAVKYFRKVKDKKTRRLKKKGF